MNACNQRSRFRCRKRSGAATVESALLLPIIMIVILTMLDLGMSVSRFNSLSDCARHVARAAIVRGELSTQPLGPEPWTGTAADNCPLADIIRHRIVSLPPDQVEMHVEWPDGGHNVGQRVRVSLEYEQSSIMLDMFGAWKLSGQSTMYIIH